MKTFDEYWASVSKMLGEENRQVALHAWVCAQSSELEIKAANYGLQNARTECPACGEVHEHTLLEKAFTDGAHWQSEHAKDVPIVEEKIK